MGTILKVEDINVYYGSIHAIKGISFEVDEGGGGHPHRRQRRGEVHHPEHHLRPAAEQDRLHRVHGGEPGQGPLPQGGGAGPGPWSPKGGESSSR